MHFINSVVQTGEARKIYPTNTQSMGQVLIYHADSSKCILSSLHLSSGGKMEQGDEAQKTLKRSTLKSTFYKENILC